MKSVLQIFREGDRGQLLPDMEDALQQIVNAIEEHGGSGSITVKAKIKKKGDAYIIGTELKFDVPQPPRVESLFFFDAENREMTRKDPRQPQIPAVVEAEFNNKRRHAEKD